MKIHFKWPCPYCTDVFNSRQLKYKHLHEVHEIKCGQQPKQSLSCKFCGKTAITTLCGMRLHERRCKKNPNPAPYNGHSVSAEQKQILRERALEGYKSGRWHGWMNCHSSKKSYPEEFFTKVIENEFNDKDYEYNYQFFQYRLDFAWVKKKRCIEIDGKQHQRNEQQAESDLRKDAKLIENGWQVLRIKWKEMYADPKSWISIAKNFVGE